MSSITGSGSQTRGVSTEIGTVEAAIDLTMGIEYGRDILQTVEEVRRRISERVQSMTGLQVTELNATVNDIVFPEGRPRRRAALSTSEAETRALPERESEAPTTTARTEGESPAAGETAELSSEDVEEARQTSDEAETRPDERREES